jgi:hypothetical protein
MAMCQEEVDPILLSYELDLLDFDVVLLFNQQIFKGFAEMVRSVDNQTFNFGSIYGDLGNGLCGLIGGGGCVGRGEVEFLKEGNDDGNGQKGVDDCLNKLDVVDSIIH